MQLRDAANALVRPVQAPRNRRRWFTKRRIAIMLAVDLVVGSVAWHYLTESHPSAVASAVEGAASDAAHGNWAGLYARMCSSDKAQSSEADFAQAGQAAVLQLGGLNHVTVTAVTATHVALGPIHLPAATASGEIVPRFGTPSPYTVTVVRELGGWKMCLSAGGYSSTALGVNVPLGAGRSPAL